MDSFLLFLNGFILGMALYVIILQLRYLFKKTEEWILPINFYWVLIHFTVLANKLIDGRSYGPNLLVILFFCFIVLLDKEYKKSAVYRYARS